jgi:hypothetical protein
MFAYGRRRDGRSLLAGIFRTTSLGDSIIL